MNTTNSGLEYALCALSFYRGRHIWKERGSRRGALVQNRVKDLSASGNNRRACRTFIRKARAVGFRGSILAKLGQGKEAA